ncbi:MAG: endonuclease/exonuclease/phosphatase family protein [Bacteroidetes bacterium]|jgi:predicted extracellular nuclease|nr:endonuclease/exonuclease/phosphatase family protein [Bacteroidota bacterium]
MKKMTVLIIWIFISTALFAQQTHMYFYLASWNLENLFDNLDDPDKNDEEWLPEGSKKWDDEKLNYKIKNLSKIIRYMNDLDGPDILGVVEVEHQHLLDTLLNRHFCDRQYKVAYHESLDNRGIDCGLIYDSALFSLKNITPLEVKLDDGYPTRYILQVELEIKNFEEIIYVFVNHWPSRRGGESESESNRISAAETLNSALHKIYNEEKSPNIFIVGDFNDEPDNISIHDTLGASEYYCDSLLISSPKKLYNLAYKKFKDGLGSYMYKSQWNMLDQIIVSESVISENNLNYVCNSFELVKPEILLTLTGSYKGASRPSYAGNRYLGGFSDHFPVGARFVIKRK